MDERKTVDQINNQYSCIQYANIKEHRLCIHFFVPILTIDESLLAAKTAICIQITMLSLFSVIEEALVIKVIGEPVLKLNTGILKCQVPSSMKHQVQIVSWKFGNNYIYPTKTWSKGD